MKRYLLLLLLALPVSTAADGTTLELPSSSHHIRVKILSTKSVVRVSCPVEFHYGLRSGGITHASVEALKIRASGSSLIVGTKRIQGDVIVAPSSHESLVINGRRYRGTLLFHPLGNSRVEVVEYMRMSEYLFGVLPKEVDPKWHLEALKAQAVVSRSYALASKRARAKERYDVTSTVLDQVYGGEESESPETTRAVLETKNYVLLDMADKPVRAFFHAACGGMTERPESVWQLDPSADIYGVCEDKEFCSTYPMQRWTLTLSYSVLRERLRRAGVRLKNIKSVEIHQKSPSGRAQIFLIQTSKGEIHIAGNRFRLALGPEALRSTFITDVDRGKKSVTFKGLGWGHGVGLCQWGAKGRAEAGQKYQQILLAYYPKARVVPL